MTEQVVAAAVGLRVTGRAHRSPARSHERLDRVGHRVAVGRVAVPGPHRQDLADSLADEPARVRDIWVEAPHGADLQHRAGVGDRPGDRLALLDADAHRLLDQHVLARGDGPQRHPDMELVGDRDDDRVDLRIGEHLVVVELH